MKIVVTAGPTREPIDPVRFISNRSSGKMGYALAEAALEAGHEVTLISGPVAITPPPDARLREDHDGGRALSMRSINMPPACDVLVMCAAVSDYKPAQSATRKLEKREKEFALQLRPTRDILASLPREPRAYRVVGFAAETHDLETSARKKTDSKKLRHDYRK